MDKIPGPAYRVHSRRLVLRCWHPADAALMKKAVDASLEHLKPWLPWAHDEPEELEEKITRLRKFRGKFDLGQDYVYAIFNQDETEVLGGTGLHTRAGQGAREIGYWIHQDYVNQGFATESTAALVRVAFEIDQVKRVHIHCNPENVHSAAIPARLGFTHEATLKQRMPFFDQLQDEMIWTLFSEDYPGSPGAQAEIEAFDAAGRQIL